VTDLEIRGGRGVRSDYAHWTTVSTRWMDNDIYGHVNNVVYYAYFDTAVNRFAIEKGGLDIRASAAIGVVVESGCRYHAPLAFPNEIDAGLRVDRIGRSSIRYAVGLFQPGQLEASADGHFVHVMVDRATRRPTDIPKALRNAATGIALPRVGSRGCAADIISDLWPTIRHAVFVTKRVVDSSFISFTGKRPSCSLR
jgi:acyl-CoA thioester hydrolase